MRHKHGSNLFEQAFYYRLLNIVVKLCNKANIQAHPRNLLVFLKIHYEEQRRLTSKLIIFSLSITCVKPQLPELLLHNPLYFIRF